MTKEQEAIEKLEYYLKNSAYKRENSDFFKNGGWEIVDLEIPKAIETVLNMLKEKEVEIANLKQALARNIAKNFTSSMKESAKSKEDLEMLNKGWQIELEKKDKIIYEMIDAFIDLGFGFEYCSNDDRCINDCDKCIKQYFERKSEE